MVKVPLFSGQINIKCNNFAQLRREVNNLARWVKTVAVPSACFQSRSASEIKAFKLNCHKPYGVLMSSCDQALYQRTPSNCKVINVPGSTQYLLLFTFFCSQEFCLVEPEPESQKLKKKKNFRTSYRVCLCNFSCGLFFRSTELDLLYPDLKEYIADMNVMMALIINGPV